MMKFNLLAAKSCKIFGLHVFVVVIDIFFTTQYNKLAAEVMDIVKSLQCSVLGATSGIAINTIEMHTGGGPVRIVMSCFPNIIGDTLLDKRLYLLHHLNQARRTLLCEPRGHDAMYAVFLVKPDMPEAHIAVLFSYGEYCGYMCGYATIALGRFAVDFGLVKAVSPETTVKIQCPCGLVTAKVEYNIDSSRSGTTKLESVPCFVFATNLKVNVERYNEIECDIVFGGTFYAYADISQFGINFETSTIEDIIKVSMALTKAAALSLQPVHPELKEASYISGTILYDGTQMDHKDVPQRFILVYGNCHVERSGCGSGSCGFLALLHHKGFIKINELKTFVNGKTKSQIVGRVIKQVNVRDIPAVIVEISGKAFYTGERTFYCEADDPLPILQIK